MSRLFNPPLYLQRYQFVIEFVKGNKPQKVVDLGCNKCALLRKLKFHREIELLAGVDIDSAVIRENMYTLAPFPADYIKPDDDPLTIEIYQGSVTERDPRMKGFDLVTSIELIEHLQLDDVDRFAEVVFGYMAPAAVIISTPNADFNPLLPGLTGFRDYDHKFEWTRAEFQRWALGVCREFGYEVEFTGVGDIPGQQESVGFCSQIGVFRRHSSDVCLQNDATEEPLSYRLMYNVMYPSLCDNNILQRTLVNEVLYWAHSLKSRWLEETAGWEEDASSEEHTEEEEEGPSEDNQMGEEQEVEREQEEDDQTGGGQGPYRSGRSVCVPLVRLWSYPRVRALSGTVPRLREFLLNDSQVRLTENGSAVVLAEVEEDDEDLVDCADTPTCPETSQPLLSCVESEDWEAEIL